MLEFLLRRGEEEMTRRTLDCMALGGMYDVVGGGFHRYSVDERWLVPHFEKMLYDNALLAPLYLQGWLVTGRRLTNWWRDARSWRARSATCSSRAGTRTGPSGSESDGPS